MGTSLESITLSRIEVHHLMKRIILVLVFGAFWIAGASFAGAATIPAGTPLVARTLEPISTHERVGGVVKAELEQDVVISGKVLLRAGRRSQAWSNLVPASPIVGRTHGELDRSLGKRAQRTGSYYRRLQAREVQDEDRRFRLRLRGQFPYRTPMVFQLAQPVKL